MGDVELTGGCRATFSPAILRQMTLCEEVGQGCDSEPDLKR